MSQPPLGNWIAVGVGTLAVLLGIEHHMYWLDAGFFLALAVAILLK